MTQDNSTAFQYGSAHNSTFNLLSRSIFSNIWLRNYEELQKLLKRFSNSCRVQGTQVINPKRFLPKIYCHCTEDDEDDSCPRCRAPALELIVNTDFRVVFY